MTCSLTASKCRSRITPPSTLTAGRALSIFQGVKTWLSCMACSVAGTPTTRGEGYASFNKEAPTPPLYLRTDQG
ncbi:unnamed protein product [Ectocarpus sp. CCAP 1310/34]|nr:unnamed protein product [Ectocarpus sp. CCAP 1310/34]